MPWKTIRAPVAVSDTRHLIGLLLGAEEDWPRAFEAIVERNRGPLSLETADAHPLTPRQVEQAGAKKDVDLIDVRNVV